VRPTQIWLATVLAGGGALLAACNLGSTPTPATTATTATTVPPTTITSVETNVIRDQCQLGKAETFSPGLQLLVGAPTSSTGPLGTGNGYPPRFGYYVTFMVTATDVGSQPVLIDPGFDYPTSHTGFVVNEEGDPGVTVLTGNTPFDGSLTSLDTTELNPGNKVGPGGVTFDVPSLHGKLTYIVSGSLVCSWSF
jgi:hypothetical protein